jgi:hypothetical protein
MTIHKQITDLLSDAGTEGITLNVSISTRVIDDSMMYSVTQAISNALCNLDKRSIELLLSRAEKNPAPSHLRDLAVVGVMESHGRERRNRYFTLASYRELINQENIDHPGNAHANIDLSDVGGFTHFDLDVFYEEKQAMFDYQDIFKDNEKARISKPRKYPVKNPILPDGTVKLGRPRKHPLPIPGNDTHSKATSTGTTNAKRPHDGDEADKGSPARKKKRIDSPIKAGEDAPRLCMRMMYLNNTR